MSDRSNAELGEKLDQIICLIAQYSSASAETKNERIIQLGQAGLDRNLIAEICDDTPSNVSVVLSRAKKKAKAKK